MTLRVAAGRVAQALLLLIAVTTAAFVLVRVSPGEPGALLYGPNVSPAEIAQLRERWGLNSPPHVQYVQWLSNVVSGDLGRSYVDGRPVTEIILERVPATLELTLTALALALMAGTLMGLHNAIRPESMLSNATNLVCSLLYSAPPFWLGLLLILGLSTGLGLVPAGGIRGANSEATAGDLLRHLVLPALALGSRDAARYARLTRAAAQHVLTEDYVRTAVAKGLAPRVIAVRHVLRNALLPALSLQSTTIPGLLSGAVVIETVFSWPGMGRLIIESSLQRNYPVILGEVLVVAVFAIAGGFVADLACGLADPRTRRSEHW